jgi:hypothetical protein
MKRKYYIRSVNFGDDSNLANVLIKDYVHKNGNQALSKLIRELIVENLDGGNKKIHLLLERKRISKEIVDLLEKRRKIDDKLRDEGINPEVDI